MKSVTLKFTNDRGRDNKAFDEAMKKNPPKIKELRIQTAKGMWRKIISK